MKSIDARNSDILAGLDPAISESAMIALELFDLPCSPQKMAGNSDTNDWCKNIEQFREISRANFSTALREG